MLFDGKEINQIKNALSELYKNLSYMTLSGARTFDFDAISELISRISFIIKGSTLLNRDRRNHEIGEKVEETIVINDDVDIASEKLKIITSNFNKIHLAANKIKKKYKKQKSVSTLRAKSKKAADWLRGAGYLDTDD